MVEAAACSLGGQNEPPAPRWMRCFPVRDAQCQETLRPGFVKTGVPEAHNTRAFSLFVFSIPPAIIAMVIK
ncbi:hypothetical protein SAMN05421753_11672 [Planctomicrobium piriforme]|uniref:Uncharacterized protein n=1 Tax=Planctomicrobium piriforme TaxID=1576369 RepID=A0A1I3P8K9_9PLAN|nr:hypothetical protein SAMN05421753_11672 [Planctomicrobium piriforme]